MPNTSLLSRLDIYDCDNDVEVNDLVFAGPSSKLKKAKADSISTMPALGIVTRKVSTSKCIVEKHPLLDGFTSIINNRTYFVSATAAGGIQDAPPTTPTHVSQVIAHGVGPNSLSFNIEPTNHVTRS